MRPELNEIQYIEKYLQGKLTKAEKLAFESELLQNSDFKEKVEVQKQLMQGVENSALRHSISKAFNKFKFNSKLKWGFGTAGLIVVLVGALLLVQDFSEGHDYEGFVKSEEVSTATYIPKGGAGESLSSQFFTVKGDCDTVIQTEDGIVFAIQSGAFLDDSRAEVKGEINIEVKEALKTQDILSSGLSTSTSDGNALETGGMFYIKAQQGGEDLKINAKKGIYTKVPTGDKKPGMKLWTGTYKSNGEVVWNAPKELKKFLIPVDMSLLNFYPKDFESNLARLGFPNATSEQKDSVYYSFASHFTKSGREQFVIGNNSSEALSLDSFAHELLNSPHYKYPLKTGLNPANVKSFWNEKFNGSLLATKEFEKRMQLIHKTGSEAILELYVKNLEKRISEIDKMAAEQSHGKLKAAFLEFAALNEGRVETDKQMVKMMNNFYRRKQLKYKSALAKASRYWKKQQEKDKEIQKMNKQFQSLNEKRKLENFKQELQDNLDTVYKQLGYKNGPVVTYDATVTSTGWNNIDKQVLKATVSRSSQTFTENGKTARLSYSQLAVSTYGDFDRVYAYVLTPSLPSFQRMEHQKDTVFKNNKSGDLAPYPLNKFSFKINDFYKNGLAIIGYKNDEAYTFFESTITADEVKVTKGDSLRIKQVTLKRQSEKEFYKNIQRLTGRRGLKKEVKRDQAFQEFFHQDKKRKQKLASMVDFRRELQEYVFPLYYLSGGQYKIFPEDRFDKYFTLETEEMQKENNWNFGLILVNAKYIGSPKEKSEFEDYELLLKVFESTVVSLINFNGRNYFRSWLGVDKQKRYYSKAQFEKKGHYYFLNVKEYRYQFIESNFELVVNKP